MNCIIAVSPLILGAVLDFIVGDPYSLPHPVRLIGRLINTLEGTVRKAFPRHLLLAGVILSVSVIVISSVLTLTLLLSCYRINTVLGVAAESILCCYMLAARCLCDESMKVCRAVREHDTEKARRAVAMIVGRDTDRLDESGIVRAAVETVAENTSDGVTAPLFYMAFGGAVGAVIYKAVNTMDSMIGYKNEKYLYLGRFAAKLDDVLNFVPSRLSALMMIAAARILGYNYRGAWRIWRRDRNTQPSPNAPQTETVTAGALDLQLLGDAYYFGKLHHKNTIGDDIRDIEAEDIPRANRLMFMTSTIMLIFSAAVRIAVAALSGYIAF